MDIFGRKPDTGQAASDQIATERVVGNIVLKLRSALEDLKARATGQQTERTLASWFADLKALTDGTLTNGVAQTVAPHGFHNWQPIAATSGSDTTPANGTQFVTSLFVPVNKTITGIGYLIGSVGGTDKVYAALYDASGALLANSSLTTGGATVGTAANVQTLDFTTPYAAVGPRLYYVGISMNGNTARLRSVPAHCQAGLFAGSVSQTHGTVAAIVAPTTFTADKAPALFAY